MVSAGGGALVLIVDDFVDGREMIHEYLEASGFRARDAASGEEAIALALELMPDLVLMDLTLPVMDGCEATRRLKQDPRTAHIPIIALSGHGEPAYIEAARAAGCDAFVTKPYRPEDLVREVRAQLADGAAARVVQAVPDTAPIVVELEAWLARHAIKFRNSSLERLPKMREAAAAKEYEVIRVFGHNLRGMGGSYGMDEVTRIGHRLEDDAPAGRDAEIQVALDELEALLTRMQVVAK